METGDPMKATVLLIIFGFIYLISPFFRMFIKNMHNVYFYAGKDIFLYFKEQKWKLFGYYGIDMFIGMFGHGKTLSMTHKARKIYKKFGDSIRIFSNYELKGIPYTPLINFNQLVDIGEEEDNSRYVGTVVLIDEIENVLSHRNYANFPLEMLHMLTQQRKKHVYIMCSAQRFFMVDKLFRSITTHAIDCKKIWRWQNMKYYDAWDYENAVNPQILKPMSNIWWFVHNYDYESYDTEKLVSKGMAEDFISNEEAIVRKGLDASVNADAIHDKRLNRRMRQQRRNAKSKRR